MKSKYNRLSRLNQIVLALAATGALMSSAYATTTYTWTGTTSGNWSDSTKWDTNGVPASDVTNSLVAFNPGATYSVTPQVNSAWNTTGSGSINSLSFSTGTVTLTNGLAGTNLTLGSGGFTNATTNNAAINFANVAGGTLTTAGSQTWNINTAGTNNKGLTFSGNLVADNSADVLTVNYGLCSYSGITFNGAYTTPYSGSLQTGSVASLGTAQTYFSQPRSGNFDRFANLIIDNATQDKSQRVVFTGAADGNNVTTNITFQNFLNSSNGRAMLLGCPYYGSPAGSLAVSSVHLGFNLNFTGTLSGALVGKTNGNPQYSVVELDSNGGAYTLSGNNSSLTIDTNNVAQNKGAFSILGFGVANNTNALGLNNSLGVNIGQYNGAVPYGRAGLLATPAASPINADIAVNGNSFTNAGVSAQPGFACVGLLPTAANTDSVTYNGNVYSRGYGYAQNTIRFVTGLVNDSSHGGTLIHTGNIQDLVQYGYWDTNFTAAVESPVQYLGTGTFQVNGANVYVGDTSIRSGTVLAGDNASAGFSLPVSGTGGTMPKVGTAASAGATSITLNATPGTAGLYVGQPFGCVQFGFASGTRITSISGNVIGLSHPLIGAVGVGVRVPAGGAFGFHNTAISLGDNVPAVQNVKAASRDYNEYPTIVSWTAGVYTFSGSNGTTLDGQALSVGDLVLIWGQYANTERNGVYHVDSTTQWSRASGWDTTTAMLAKMGSRIHVTNGSTCAGFDFELAPVNINSGVTWTINSVAGGAAANSAPVAFVPDVGSPNVAILTNGAYTIARPINVTNNQSTGTSSLGGNTSDSSTFSGLVTLSKDLTVTAASSGTVTFSGDITGSNNVTKAGSGLVKFSTAKSYTGTTTVSAGTLEVDNTIASGGVSVGTGGTLQGTGIITNTLSVTGTGVVSPGLVAVGALYAGDTTISGHLAANVDDLSANELISTGTINLAGGTVDVTVGGGGFTQPYYVIAAASTITGTPSVTTGYTLTNTGTELRLSLTPTTHSISGTVTRSGSALSGVTVSDGTRTATTDGSGAYTITSVPDSATYTVTPSLTGYTFSPANQSVTLSGSDVTGINFAVANAYGNWATIHGLSGADAATTANPSHDGLSNLVKYALDLNPAVSAQPAGTLSGSTLSFTKGAMAKADSNLVYSIEESTDLTTWTAPTGSSPSGSVSNLTNTITYTFPSGQTKVFARLKVVQNP